MRRHLLAVPVLVLVACTSPPEPAAGGAVRLMIVGTVDLAGSAALVARADPEGCFARSAGR
jgi:hypothetical protein